MKVLIVEDDPTDRKLAIEVLKMSGHIVRANASAEEAFSAIAADKPDVILLDLRLPGMDGLAFASRIKADEATRSIPVVAVTGYPDEYRRNELIAAGCAACITKPIDTRDLARQLEQIAEQKA